MGCKRSSGNTLVYGVQLLFELIYLNNSFVMKKLAFTDHFVESKTRSPNKARCILQKLIFNHIATASLMKTAGKPLSWLKKCWRPAAVKAGITGASG